MKKLFFVIFTFVFVVASANAEFTSCGPGYVLEPHAKVDGMNAKECKKLWCMDLETGKMMGKNNSANSGYKSTNTPNELCDATGKCIECFGERKWCGGEVVGEWMREYGAYKRGNTDSTAYKSYQKGGCFAWRLEKKNCPDGQTAVLKDGEWHCTSSTGTDVGSRASSVRRTGAIRRRLP